MISARVIAAFVEDNAEKALEYAAASLRAPNAHLYVCIIAALIFSALGEAPRASSALQKARAQTSDFERAHFLKLFNLAGGKHASLVEAALDRLAL